MCWVTSKELIKGHKRSQVLWDFFKDLEKERRWWSVESNEPLNVLTSMRKRESRHVGLDDDSICDLIGKHNPTNCYDQHFAPPSSHIWLQVPNDSSMRLMLIIGLNGELCSWRAAQKNLSAKNMMQISSHGNHLVTTFPPLIWVRWFVFADLWIIRQSTHTPRATLAPPSIREP